MTLDTSIPISFHPDTLDNMNALGPHLDVAKGALDEIYETWSKINGLEKQIKDRRGLAAAASSAMSRVTRRVDERMKQLKKAQEINDVAIGEVLNQSRPDPASSEIRSHFKNQEHSASQVSKFILEGDKRTAQAIFGAPAYLSGLSQKDVDALQEAALQVMAPEAHAKRAQLTRAIDRIQAAGTEFIMTNGAKVKEWGTNRDNRLLKELQDDK